HSISTAVVFTGDGSHVRTRDAMAIRADFLLEGGGADRMLGVDEVVLGDVGNVTADSFVVHYPGRRVGTETEDPDYKANPARGFASPMVDTLRVVQGRQPTGSES